jgi:hypothetical protein
MRAARSSSAVRERGEVPETTPSTERRFMFLLDRDRTLLRWDASYVADVWWPPRDGEPGQWSRLPLNPFTASVTEIAAERAQEIAGPGAGLYAEASLAALEAARGTPPCASDATPTP